MFFNSSTSTNPSLVTGSTSTSKPAFCITDKGAVIELCSSGVVIIWFPLFLYFIAIPLIARLFDSLEPLVYIISLGFTFSISAICFVALLIISFASIPSL